MVDTASYLFMSFLSDSETHDYRSGLFNNRHLRLRMTKNSLIISTAPFPQSFLVSLTSACANTGRC